MSDAAQPNFPSCAYDVTIAFRYYQHVHGELASSVRHSSSFHTLTKIAGVIVCVHVLHERIPSPRKVSDWLILQLRRGSQCDISELSQGDAASCATQEATNLDGTALFGPLCITSAFANERRRLAVYNCVCTWLVMHERIPSLEKISDWLILQLRRSSRTTFCRLP